MTSEWDNTPWAGTPVSRQATLPALKAVTGAGAYSMTFGTPIASLMDTPQRRMAAFLRAYRVGWFAKAGRKVASDIAGLGYSLSPETDGGDNAEAFVPRDLSVPFVALRPEEQFLRLMEQPNPYQTGRVLRHKTMVRLDFAGNAFWYLEGARTLGTPTAIYGISPSRLHHAADRSGKTIGWVLDRDKPGGGVPFEAAEILHFAYPAEDDDVWGVGVVESVYDELPLDGQMARHTSDVLATGGRLAGMMWPKERSLDEGEFADAQRAWRNVASDPNAARRMLLFPEPMEYAQGASTPKEIGLPELATLHRDTVLSAWPISPYRLGVPMPGGLNSGELRKEDRRDYWEDTIHPRVEVLEEVIQTGLVRRYEEIIGQPLDFDIAEPNLDDPASLVAKAEAFRGLVAIGFDPSEVVSAVGLEHIPWTGLPTMLDPVHQAEMAEAAAEAQAEAPTVMPAPITKAMTRTRETTIDPLVPMAQNDLRRFFAEQRERVVAAIEASWPARKADRKADPAGWWDAEKEDATLKRLLRGLWVQIATGALGTVADQLGRVVLPDRHTAVAAQVAAAGASRVVRINEGTRDAIRATLEEGIRRGYSAAQVANGVPAEGYPGVRNAPLVNGASAFDEARAETIARTEAMLAYNESALRGYDGFGVREVLAIDGDYDDVCADRNGRTYTIDEAMTIEDHPNGTLDWAPITPEKAASEDHMALALRALASSPSITLQMPEGPAPEPVIIPAPSVAVDVPPLDLSPLADALLAQGEAIRTLAADVADLRRPTRKIVQRDAANRIVSIEEVPA